MGINFLAGLEAAATDQRNAATEWTTAQTDQTKKGATLHFVDHIATGFFVVIDIVCRPRLVVMESKTAAISVTKKLAWR